MTGPATQGYFEFNVGYRHPESGRIVAIYSPVWWCDEELARNRLERQRKMGGFRTRTNVKVPVFLINRFVPAWTEVPEPVSQ